MHYTIQCDILGRELVFSKPEYCYLYVDLNGEPGTNGTPVREGAKDTGPHVGCIGCSPESFKRLCDAWHAAYLQRIENEDKINQERG